MSLYYIHIQEKYTESDKRIQKNILLYKIHQQYQNTFKIPNNFKTNRKLSKTKSKLSNNFNILKCLFCYIYKYHIFCFVYFTFCIFIYIYIYLYTYTCRSAIPRLAAARLQFAAEVLRTEAATLGVVTKAANWHRVDVVTDAGHHSVVTRRASVRAEQPAHVAARPWRA